MNYDKFGLVFLTIDKVDIDLFDFEDILNELNTMQKSPRLCFNKLNLIIHGFDEDSREVYEIPEIRRYIQFLDRSFPYLFYYLNVDLPDRYSAHKILAACICEIEEVEQVENVKNVYFNVESIKNFIFNHFEYMNRLMKKEEYTDTEIIEWSDKVMTKYNLYLPKI